MNNLTRGNQVVWKFPFQLVDYQTIELPENAAPLTVAMQDDTLCLWAVCDQTETTYETRAFAVHGTGHAMYAAPVEYLAYLGTVQLMGGSLIFHIFEVSIELPRKELDD